jgi:hypothetical protein
VKRAPGAVAAALLFLALAPPAAAEADLTAAAKLVCRPDSLTRCQAGQCKTEPASARHKAEPLIIDFAAKKVFSRIGGDLRPEGDLTDDETTGGTRRFAMIVPRDGSKVRMTLTKAGKLTIAVGAEGDKAEAICAPES